jgi:hypothetical protein
MEALYNVVLKFHEPLVYLLLICVGIMSRAVYRIDHAVGVIDTKVNLLLDGHRMCNNAPSTSTRLARLRGPHRRRH